MRRFQHQDEVGRAEEASFVPFLSGEIAERDREVGLAHARRPEEHHVLCAFDEGNARQLHDLLARRAGGEVEVVLIERLDRGKAGDTPEHLASSRAARLALCAQQFLDEVGEGGVLLGRLLSSAEYCAATPPSRNVVGKRRVLY